MKRWPAAPGASNYPLGALLDDVRTGIWAEIYSNRVSIDPYRRALQTSLLNQLDRKLNPRHAIGHNRANILRPAARAFAGGCARADSW
jgi:hypothetical protein